MPRAGDRGAQRGGPLTVLDEKAGTVERVALELALELGEGEAGLEGRRDAIGLCHAGGASWLVAVPEQMAGMQAGGERNKRAYIGAENVAAGPRVVGLVAGAGDELRRRGFAVVDDVAGRRGG